MVHSSRRRKPWANRKGYSALLATIFMVLVVLYLYFNVFMFTLNRDTDFQDAVSRSQQLDADRNDEIVTITDASIIRLIPTGQLFLRCTLTNNGSVPVQMARLWVQDKTRNTIGNVTLSNSLVLLQLGSSRVSQLFPPVSLGTVSASDSFYVWFVTFRGNSFSQTVTSFVDSNFVF